MFKVAGPLWAQATGGGDNVFLRLAKTGKKVLRRVLQKREIEPTTTRELPKPIWTLRSHTVKVDESASRRLIGGLFPKQALKTQAAEARKQAALRLIRDAKKVPVFAFVGLSLGASLDHQSQKKGAEADDVLCSGIRGLFQQYGGKESTVDTGGQHFSLQSLHLGQLIGQGCNAAVFEARPAPTEPDVAAEENKETAEANTACSDVAAPGPATESVQSQTAAYSDGHSVEEDNLPSISESTDDDDDDISIISDNGEESGTEESLDGWVLYRLSFFSKPAAGESSDDSDSDIFILAGDEEGLESLPDLEELASEFSWSEVKGYLPGSGTAEGVTVDSSRRGTDDMAMQTATGSADSSLCAEPPDGTSSATTGKPEPAPNIQEGDGEFPLAVKMMYNYSVESKADHIMSAMVRETIPSMAHPSQNSGLEHSSVSLTKRLPPHPNIVTMYDVFVDQTPDLPEGTKVYPSALPPRLNKDGGFGRNATMFLVMKKYSMTLSDYLSSHAVDMRTRCLLFTQLLEGVAHLNRHGMAHRDLKGNNVLVELSDGPGSPHLAISDFGSCLADAHYGLTLPYLTADTDKGGNSALMAPEIKCAMPGPNSTLDYSKADIWAAGTLAFELFGQGNPFYNGLDSRSYKEEDLPKLPDDAPEVVVKLVEAMMKRDPAERPTPAVAATCLELFLWGPPELQPFANHDPAHSNSLWRFKEISHWLEQLTMETVCQRVFGGRASRLDLQMKSTFLSRISRQDVFGVVSFEA